MIFVTLGTQKHQFDRLLKYIEESNIDDEIIVQAGYTKFKSKKMKIINFMDDEEMVKYIQKANLVITHGDIVPILNAIKINRKVIACPRLEKYGEDDNNNQEQIVSDLSENGYILKLDESTSLDKLYKKSIKFKPNKFVNNNYKFKEKLIDTINKNRFDLLFSFVFILIIFLIPLIIFLRPSKKISVSESRTLTQLQPFTFKSFNDGNFQDNIEKYLEDQMVLGTTMKNINNKFKTKSRSILLNVIFRNDKIIPLEKGYCLLKGSDGDKYLIYCPKTMANFKEPLENNIATLNKIIDKYSDSNVKIKAFRITTDEDFSVSNEIDKVFENNYKGEYKSLDLIYSYEDVEKYFFKSDHHWNYLGSYEGYKQIMSLLDKNYIEPKGNVCFNDTLFVGSIASQTREIDIAEKFCVYKFNYPKFNITVYGPEDKLGHPDDYFNGNYKKGKSNNHYRNFYGGGFGEVIIDNIENTSNDNILLIIDSMTDANARLIATSYDHTFIVDLRRYETYINKIFNLNDYVKSHDIKTVLFVGNIRFFITDGFIPKISL